MGNLKRSNRSRRDTVSNFRREIRPALQQDDIVARADALRELKKLAAAHFKHYYKLTPIGERNGRIFFEFLAGIDPEQSRIGKRIIITARRGGGLKYLKRGDLTPKSFRQILGTIISDLSANPTFKRLLREATGVD